MHYAECQTPLTCTDDHVHVRHAQDWQSVHVLFLAVLYQDNTAYAFTRCHEGRRASKIAARHLDGLLAVDLPVRERHAQALRAEGVVLRVAVAAPRAAAQRAARGGQDVQIAPATPFSSVLRKFSLSLRSCLRCVLERPRRYNGVKSGSIH